MKNTMEELGRRLAIAADKRPYMSPDEAAEYLGVSKSHLAQLRMRNEGPRCSQRGAITRYMPLDLDLWMEAEDSRIDQKVSQQMAGAGA